MDMNTPMTDFNRQREEFDAEAYRKRIGALFIGEWKPIMTAPKDGTYILVFGERYDHFELPPFAITKWIVEIRDQWEQTNQDTQKLVKRDNSHFAYSGISETHWMPLPLPPVGGKALARSVSL